METLEQLSKVNWIEWLIILFAIMTFVTWSFKLVGEFSKIIGKPFKWVTDKNKDHETIIKTSKALEQLQEQHEKDDKEMRDNIKNLTSSINDLSNVTKNRLDEFAENRVHDRGQSFEIQDKLTSTIDAIRENDKKRDSQIASLMLGTMELLGDKIDQKFSKYVELNGIPENEIKEFDGLYTAYAATGGNSTRKDKYEYVKNHLKVIPVKVDILRKAGDSNG